MGCTLSETHLTRDRDLSPQHDLFPPKNSALTKYNSFCYGVYMIVEIFVHCEMTQYPFFNLLCEQKEMCLIVLNVHL